MNNKLCAFFIGLYFLNAFAADGKNRAFPPFHSGTMSGITPFDATVIAFSSHLSQKTAARTQEINHTSDFANIHKQLAHTNLNLLVQKQEISTVCEKIYNDLKNDLRFKEVFSTAKKATDEHAPLEERRTAWALFRSTGASALLALRDKELPSIHNASPKCPDKIAQDLALNKDVSLNEIEKNIYSAYYVVLFSLRQIQRLYDPETDGGNVLLHRNITQ